MGRDGPSLAHPDVLTDPGPAFMGQMELDRLKAAAEVALGAPLVSHAVLRGSIRSTVLRCRTADDRSVVVKQFASTRTVNNSGGYGFAREWAALQTVPDAPRMLAADTDLGLIVMEDLGTHPTLADVLLGDDADAARSGLLDWAGSVGRTLAADPAMADRFVALVRERDPASRTGGGPPSPQLATAGVDRLAAQGVRVPDRVAGELARMDRLSGDGSTRVLSPNDFCPDNALVTPDGIRLIDLEGTALHHPALAIAYLVMPFPTCWCLAAFPDGMSDELWQACCAAAPALATVWEAPEWPEMLELACANHVLVMTELSLNGLLDGDIPLAPASGRRRLASRWLWAADRLQTLPGVAELCRNALDHWPGWDPELPGYPAFRR